MTEAAVVILGLVGTAGAGAVVTAVAKIFSVYTIQGRIEQKLDDHITDEKGKFEHIYGRFDDIESRLPNGEIKRLIGQLRRFEGRMTIADRKAKDQRSAARLRRRK